MLIRELEPNSEQNKEEISGGQADDPLEGDISDKKPEEAALGDGGSSSEVPDNSAEVTTDGAETIETHDSDPTADMSEAGPSPENANVEEVKEPKEAEFPPIDPAAGIDAAIADKESGDKVGASSLEQVHLVTFKLGSRDKH